MFRVEQFYLLRQGLSVSSKASRCLLLLSLGICSVEYIIKQKRILYLHNLLTKSESSLVVKVFNPMRNSNVKSDWINTTLTDLRDLGIDKNLDQISTMCKNQFKVLVKSSVRNACFQSLLREKHKLKKGAEMCFEKFEILPYLHSTSCLNVSSMRTRPGVSSCPPGCKISLCNSTISIEPNFATFNEITSVESIINTPNGPKKALTWP